jgi:hypothetical protein
MSQVTQSCQSAGGAPVKGRPRPPIFRALGRREPPAEVEVQGQLFGLQELLKHDSWAATAIYANGDRKIVCKFNRCQPLLLIPMSWLGRILARREADQMRRLADVANIPADCGPVRSDGRILDNAVAHEYAPGKPLRFGATMPEAFQELHAVVTTMHDRGVAYVDLHKAENIIVGDDGRPYLIDFQICFRIPDGWWGRRWLVKRLFRVLTNADLYHLEKHRLSPLRCKLSHESFRAAVNRPWWIEAHRLVAVPFRSARRSLLVFLGIRRRGGQAESEHQPEKAVQLKMADLQASTEPLSSVPPAPAPLS